MLTLALLLVSQWAATNALNLQGGNYVTFGEVPQLSGASRVAAHVTLYRDSTVGLPSGGRILMSHEAPGKKQLRVTVAGFGLGSPLVNICIAPSATSSYVCRGLTDTPENQLYFNGNRPHLIAWSFNAGVVELVVDGHRLELTGTGVMPVALGGLDNGELRIGSTDKLQATVGDFALWIGDIPDTLQLRAAWNENLVCDLRLGFCRGPRAESVLMPTPLIFAPMSDDTLPVIAPFIGENIGLVVPGPGALVAKVPRTPVLGADSYSDYHFQLKFSGEGYDPSPYVEAPALLFIGADLHLCVTKGSAHTSADQSIVCMTSHDYGRTWPWPFGQAWPGSIERYVTAVEPDGMNSYKGSSLCEISGGRVLHFFNKKPNTPPTAGTIERHPMYRISDDRMNTWSAPLEIPAIGTQWTAWPQTQTCLERSDGTVVVTAYARSFIPGTFNSQGWYTSWTVESTDKGATFHTGNVIASGQLDGNQYEEANLGRLSSGCPGAGSCWGVLQRVDTPLPARIFRSYSFDEGHTFTAPVPALAGWNAPRWLELADGTVLLLTRKSTGNAADCISQLWWTHGGIENWAGHIDLSQPGDTCNQGSALAISPHGEVMVVYANDQGSTRTRLDMIKLKPEVWAP